MKHTPFDSRRVIRSRTLLGLVMLAAAASPIVAEKSEPEPEGTALVASARCLDDLISEIAEESYSTLEWSPSRGEPQLFVVPLASSQRSPAGREYVVWHEGRTYFVRVPAGLPMKRASVGDGVAGGASIPLGGMVFFSVGPGAPVLGATATGEVTRLFRPESQARLLDGVLKPPLGIALRPMASNEGMQRIDAQIAFEIERLPLRYFEARHAERQRLIDSAVTAALLQRYARSDEAVVELEALLKTMGPSNWLLEQLRRRFGRSIAPEDLPFLLSEQLHGHTKILTTAAADPDVSGAARDLEVATRSYVRAQLATRGFFGVAAAPASPEHEYQQMFAAVVGAVQRLNLWTSSGQRFERSAPAAGKRAFEEFLSSVKAQLPPGTAHAGTGESLTGSLGSWRILWEVSRAGAPCSLLPNAQLREAWLVARDRIGRADVEATATR